MSYTLCEWHQNDPEYPGLYLVSVRIKESNYTMAYYFSEATGWVDQGDGGKVYGWSELPQPMPYWMRRESAERSIKQHIDKEVGLKKTEWVINGIKVTMAEEDSRDTGKPGEFRNVSYVFRMDGARAEVLEGFYALEKMVWLNKLERDQ